MSATERIERARSACGQGVRYGLGRGGFHPADPLPCRASWRKLKPAFIPVRALWCDCSGFVAWVLGMSRKPSKAWPWWLSTDSIWTDATGKQQLFRRIPAAIAGCIAVYPDYKGADGKRHEGHVAIVTDPDRMMAVDCSGSQDGVTERVVSYFWHRASTVFCVPVGDP